MRNETVPGNVPLSEWLGRTAAHTPGPWHDMKDGEIIPLKSVYCERLGFQIGFVNTDRKSVEAQAKANAYLIAAAPELLAALIECAKRLEIHITHTEDLIAHMQAHKAIGRAVGLVSP